MQNSFKTQIPDEEIIKELQEYRESHNKKVIIVTIIVIIIIAFLCIIGASTMFKDNHSINENSNYSNSSYNNLNASCYYYSQRLVKEKLKSPKSAEFPKYSAEFISRDEDTVTVSAYVEADNSFGAHVKTNYIATIQLKNNEPVSGSVVIIE